MSTRPESWERPAHLLHPTFDPKADFEVLATGVAASPGAAKGEVVFSAAEAVEKGGNGRDVVLVRPFTEADDVAGFHPAKAILTSEGGKASHAALVACGMGRPAVVGTDALTIDVKSRVITGNGYGIHSGDRIAIDGPKSCVTLADAPLVESQVDATFETVLGWADQIRRLNIRANADDPGARVGAEGIGLCRTEHMFMAEDRQPFHMASLDYVSCSPFRVPIARVAAAQATIAHAGTPTWGAP
jgi:pyruvate, orthophosphate dikinase